MTLRLAMKHLLSKPVLSAFTLFAVAGSLTILGAFWTVLENLDRVRVKSVSAITAEPVPGLTLFVDSKLKSDELDTLKSKVMATKKFSAIEVVPANEALKSLESQFGETLSKAFTNETLPTTLKLGFDSTSLKREELFDLLNTLRSIPGVIEIDDGTSVLPTGKAAPSLSNHVMSWATALLTVVFAIVALLVSHLIRIAFESLKPEIETLKILGASKFWIFRPLFLEGLFFGILGGLSSLVILSCLINLVLPKFALLLLPKGLEIVGLSLGSSLSLLALGILASVVGALFTWPLIDKPTEYV